MVGLIMQLSIQERYSIFNFFNPVIQYATKTKDLIESNMVKI